MLSGQMFDNGNSKTKTEAIIVEISVHALWIYFPQLWLVELHH